MSLCRLLEGVESTVKKSFYSPLASDARSHFCRVRIHAEEERRPIRLREFRSKIYISFRNWGVCVDTVF